jgi:hypothetical protein
LPQKTQKVTKKAECQAGAGGIEGYLIYMFFASFCVFRGHVFVENLPVVTNCRKKRKKSHRKNNAKPEPGELKEPKLPLFCVFLCFLWPYILANKWN